MRKLTIITLVVATGLVACAPSIVNAHANYAQPVYLSKAASPTATETSVSSPTPTPTKEPFTPTPETTISDSKLIVVKLSTQREFVYENGLLLREFVVSTGKYPHVTPTGDFRIEAKFFTDDMSGGEGADAYDIKDVPWVMYFGNAEISWHDGYSLHGAPWNHDLGNPHSHGCVNMSVDDASWLFDWAPMGTEVQVIE